MIEEGSLNKTLSRAIKEYLETRKKSIETWLLNKFKEDMQQKSPNTYIKDITLKDFDRFLNSLSVSPALLKNYTSRLKRFQECIGLSELKVKKNRNPKNDESLRRYELEKELAKTKKELTETENALALHKQTIDGQNAERETMIQEKDKECSQCPKTVSLNETIRLTEATLEKEREENKAKTDVLQYKIDTFVSESGEIEEIKQLQAQKAEIDEQITKGNNIMANQRFVKVRCPMKGFVVSFGNDCSHCEDYVSCPKYGELTNPESNGN